MLLNCHPEDIAQVRIGARRQVCRGRFRCEGRWRMARNCGGFCRLARCTVDDGGVNVVGGSEVTGIVGGGHAPGLPLVLPQVLLEVAGVGVGRATELASVDGGGGVCKDVRFVNHFYASFIIGLNIQYRAYRIILQRMKQQILKYDNFLIPEWT